MWNKRGGINVHFKVHKINILLTLLQVSALPKFNTIVNNYDVLPQIVCSVQF